MSASPRIERDRTRSARWFSVALIRKVCEIAGAIDLIGDAGVALSRAGVVKAIRRHDDAAIFDWLMRQINYQGVSDRAADVFIANHGSVTYRQIASVISRPQDCSKLLSYWHFDDCGYRKTAQTCNAPSLSKRCSLPRHDLRNGNLNQAAYSLFFFMRDVAEGDFVRWLDRKVSVSSQLGSRVAADQIIGSMRNIFGVSDKVLSMALSNLLLAGDHKRAAWVEAGATMIAVDTLVHAWLHRSGILASLNAAHPYGARCYRPNGCADIIRVAARQIDARAFNASYPKVFARFIQYAIWRYCAGTVLNVCNGNQIDDTDRCDRIDCAIYRACDRISLNGAAAGS